MKPLWTPDVLQHIKDTLLLISTILVSFAIGYGVGSERKPTKP